MAQQQKGAGKEALGKLFNDEKLKAVARRLA